MRIRFGSVPRRSILLLLCLPLVLSGCDAIGYVASLAAGTELVAANYGGLKGQRCGIMVWADQGVIDDYGAIQLDVARGVEQKLQEATKANIDDAKGLTWIPPEQILQYQENHPECRTEAIEDVAVRLGVTRLIYIEVEQFQTHPNDSPDLSRGTMTATVEVVEVANGVGKVAFSERGVTVVSPDNCPPEGLPNLDDGAVYQGTMEAFTSAVGERFVPHEVDIDNGTSTVDDENARFDQSQNQ
ncbi:MAG TPA: hypothetical protein VL992_16225 [Tepidisphaeraceae bacterium]|nr:hypothetical protein [Tepidisphaeraceae bacterium]